MSDTSAMTNPIAPASSLSSEDRQRIERLRRLDCCTLSDALDKLSLPGVVTGVPQRSGDERVAGIMITVKLEKVDVRAPPQGPPRHLGTQAIELGGPDHVIAVQQAEGVNAGSWGGLLTLGAKIKGIAGVVADGPVRDIDEARKYGFPIFSTSLTAVTARGRVREAATNVPVTLWGHPVQAGDFIAADRSAIILIEALHIDRILDAAENIALRESLMAKAILSGLPISQVMSGNYENMLKG